MTRKDGKNNVVEVYLFNDPEPEIGDEQSGEVDDRPMELSSRINAFFAQRRKKHDLSELDAVISSSLPRAQELAKILAEKSVNTHEKQKGRKHFEEYLKNTTEGVVLNIVPNDGYQPVLVISDINKKTVAQLGSAIEELPPGTKVLIVLSSEKLQNLTQILMNHEARLNLDFAGGIQITLGKNREVRNIRH